MRRKQDILLSLENDPAWLAQLERLERRIARVQAVVSGDAKVERHWRTGYSEKKIRKVRGHYVHRVVSTSKTGDRLVNHRRDWKLKLLRGGKT